MGSVDLRWFLLIYEECSPSAFFRSLLPAVGSGLVCCCGCTFAGAGGLPGAQERHPAYVGPLLRLSAGQLFGAGSRNAEIPGLISPARPRRESADRRD